MRKEFKIIDGRRHLIIDGIKEEIGIRYDLYMDGVERVVEKMDMIRDMWLGFTKYNPKDKKNILNLIKSDGGRI